jgi:hypothetical protein
LTTSVQFIEAVYSEFFVAWVNTTPICFDSDFFDSRGVLQFVRFSVRHSPDTEQTLGGLGERKFTRKGIIFIQVFSSIDSKNATTMVLAEKARDVFEGKSFNDYYIFKSGLREIGIKDGYYQINVTHEFSYNECK